MRAVLLLSLLASLTLIGCGDDRLFIDAGPPDAGMDAAPVEDAGPRPDAAIDAGPDSGGALADGGVDAGGPVACTLPGDCGSGVCEDGFCCAATCGDCGSCGVSGSEGTCTPVAGGSCDDGDPATHTDVCQADGTCMGETGCAPPPESCANGSQSRDGCANARIIGRSMASDIFVLGNQSTCSGSNRFDDSGSCFDAGEDHAYRLYMREGESVELRYRTRTACIGGSWDGTLKIYESTGCADTSCGNRTFCEDYINDDPVNYVAPRDGWITIVVDGSTAGSDDEGSYDFQAILTCSTADCGC